MKLNDIAYFVDDKISSDEISLNEYITTDCLLQKKKGRSIATNLPPQSCSLTKFKKGDVLIGNIRPYLKKIWFADIDGGSSLDVLLLRAKDKNESAFLYSVLMQDSFYDFVMKAPKGSKMPRGDKNHILTFPCSNVNHKIEIGNFIKSLDDKIALNRRMNAKLKQMAKRLYDHWFVQFDFPNADGKPYKSSGGKMEYNEVLKREIPAGWVVKKLCTLFTTNRGVSYSTKTITGDKGIPMINLASFSPDGSYRIDGIKIYTGEYTNEKVLKPFDLVMCNTQQTAIDFSKDIIGKALLGPDIFEGDITSSHHVNTLKVHNEKLKFYLYRLFNTDYFHAYISHFASGTNIRGLDFAGVENYTAVIPGDEILSKFADFTLNIEKKKSEIIRENTKLISLRDRLLPLLMNGQVIVN